MTHTPQDPTPSGTPAAEADAAARADAAAVPHAAHGPQGAAGPRASTPTAVAPSRDALVLVTSATGKTGRRVTERLRSRGFAVRSGSRTTTPAFDWDDASTWDAALRGCTAAYLAYVPDLAVPGAAETVAAFAARAAAAGVERLVLLSGRGETEAQRAEELVRAVGVPCTVVRSSWFAQNFSESFFLDPVLQGELALPVAGGVREPFVDLDDVADVAVAALTEDGHAGETYVVTGPEALTFHEAVAAVAGASGRDVAFVPIPLDAFTGALTADGVPPEVVGLMTYLFTEVLDGRNATPADGVLRALGRPPRSFAAFARDAAAAGAFSAGAAAGAGPTTTAAEPVR
ncbi:NmrA family NAD(P)-binding protein [Patulibacter americanus]|uniref:NmrA family NAD(P)-binding protein n=1 Tax=Patulibacter americanus TaxID=588672 RepID=UPI0003B34EAE|nr:NmrA family NAD(P)-binding protein [Patulibacter americanus]